MWTKNMQPLNNSHSLTEQSESLLYMSSAFANDLVTKNLHRIQVMLLDYLCQIYISKMLYALCTYSGFPLLLSAAPTVSWLMHLFDGVHMSHAPPQALRSRLLL